MHNGKTVERRAAASGGLAAFLDQYRAAIVILAGRAKGMEYQLDQPKVTLGRGPGVDLSFDDDTMSRVHAAVEFRGGAFHLQDAGSTNGTLLNDATVQSAQLKHGDRFQLGDHVFAFTLESRTREPKAYVLPDA
jgi:pSer/pThr/pTyr-binding forkhead associated (FHA) protein